MDDSVCCFGSWIPPPPMSTSRPPDVIHVMNAPRPSPFFTGLPLPCIIVNANGRQKRGRPGNKARADEQFLLRTTDNPQ